MGRPLLAPLAKNTFNLAPGEMERIPFGQMLQGKGFIFLCSRLFIRFESRKSHSFKVECLFGSEGGQTVIRPDDWPEEGFTFPDNDSQRCSSANCYKKDVVYVLSKAQIKSLMALSSNCTQTVTNTCNINALTGFSSWIGSNGIANSFWHGNKNSGKFQFFLQ